MTNDAPSDQPDRAKWTASAMAAAALLLVLFSVIAIGTLRGCFFATPQQAAETEKDKKADAKKKEDKPPIAIDSPVVLPSEPKVPLPPVKPGHWATASQQITANFNDFVGDSRLSVVDGQGRPYPVASTPFYLRSSRPILLSKGRPKSTQTTFFAPQSDQTVRLALELEERTLGSGPPQAFTPLVSMPSYQYHFVVLAKTPGRYAYVKTLDAVKAPFNGESDEDITDEAVHYHVVELGADQLNLLPDNPLTWTSVAYLLWDQIDAGESFPADQKQALIDWLHWGGQIIISGPDSLDLLKGSFLEPYLPATNGGAVKLDATNKDLSTLSDSWTISTNVLKGESLRPTSPWSGVQLKLQPGATEVPNTGGLFAERQVGRGRIVVSAFQLSERAFINWRSGFESFFNACLLRRQPRIYVPGHFGGRTLTWADTGLRERRLDAALNTGIYFMARDMGVATSYTHEPSNDPNTVPPVQPAAGPQPLAGPPPRAYRPPDNPGGLGAWNDYSQAAGAARQSLREAAGVEVPDAKFVVICLAAYLVALVPLNWLFFRTIGRVEWAWIAAPLIAIAGTWVIVQRAQLDIGFVRSQTEIGILEQQPDHSRAHLSRYTALYTSLSTTYDFESSNLTTLIAPFPAGADASNFQLLSGQGITPVNFRRYDTVQLNGLPVSSNSTGMVHTEQMLPLDGPIQIVTPAGKGEQIENRSNMNLHSVCIVERVGNELEGRWIGDLLPGQSIPLVKSHLPADKRPFVDQRAKDTPADKTQRLNLEPMFQLALDPKNINDGELRLVGRFDEVLPGETISPAASQVRGATLVVVHLRYAPLQTPQKDANTRQEIKNTDNEINLNELEAPEQP